MSPPLGELFPEEFKKQFASNNLKVGSVIRTKVPDTKPPKIKRFVIIGISADKLALGTLYINTEINPNLFQTQDLKDLHLKLDVEGRNYLDRTSFLDCSKVYEKEYEAMSELLKNEADCVIGELSTDDLRRVKHKIKVARTISVRVKKKFGLF